MNTLFSFSIGLIISLVLIPYLLYSKKVLSFRNFIRHICAWLLVPVIILALPVLYLVVITSNKTALKILNVYVLGYLEFLFSKKIDLLIKNLSEVMLGEALKQAQKQAPKDGIPIDFFERTLDNFYSEPETIRGFMMCRMDTDSTVELMTSNNLQDKLRMAVSCCLAIMQGAHKAGEQPSHVTMKFLIDELNAGFGDANAEERTYVYNAETDRYV